MTTATIHAVELIASGSTGVLILGVPGAPHAQKFVEIGLYGDARQYLAELGYHEVTLSQIRVTKKEFVSFLGLGDGVDLPRAADDRGDSDPWQQEPYRLGGAYGYSYAELHNPDNTSDTGSYGLIARGSRKLAQEVVNELNHAYRCGRTGQPLHRGMHA